MPSPMPSQRPSSPPVCARAASLRTQKKSEILSHISNCEICKNAASAHRAAQQKIRTATLEKTIEQTAALESAKRKAAAKRAWDTRNAKRKANVREKIEIALQQKRAKQIQTAAPTPGNSTRTEENRGCDSVTCSEPKPDFSTAETL